MTITLDFLRGRLADPTLSLAAGFGSGLAIARLGASDSLVSSHGLVD